MIGRSIGRFRIAGPLGQGGMASVWRAHDELLGRELALKILSESLAQSEDSRRRFRHEAQIAAGLDHPGIAAVYDSGETDGLTWIAMALIEGETLAERLRKSRMSIPEAIAVGIAVGDALGFAHGRGVVHRDVTARNVMLGRDGRVFVLDFGLALAQGTSRISSSGTTVGTAPYMAPELLTGATATPSSDLYGLGIVLYEALTGAVPFIDRRGAAAIFAVLNLPPEPVRDLRPEVSPALAEVVLRCIEKDPARRFESAAALLRALRELEPARAAAAPAVPAGRSVIAEKIREGSGVVYVAVPAFSSAPSEVGEGAALADIACGLTTAAAAAMSRIQRVHVIRASAPPPPDDAVACRTFARAHGANLVLQGFVRASGSRLRVGFALMDPEAGVQIAGDTLEGSIHDPFELEDRVVAALSHAMGSDAATHDESRRSRPVDSAADAHYRQAMRYLERHDHEASVDGAIALLERLVESEPGEARFHAMLARAFVMKRERTSQRVWEPRAAAAAERAVALAPDAPETLLALGDLHRSTGRLDDADREYGLALAIRPDFYEAVLMRALTLHLLGRADGVEPACARAVEMRPDDWRGHNLLGWIRCARGHYADSLAPLNRALVLAPDCALAARNLGIALFHLDRFDEASELLGRALKLEPSSWGYSNLGTVRFFAGDYVGAVRAMEESVALSPGDPISWGNLGSVCRFAPAQQERAREALGRAIGLMKEQLQRNPTDATGWAALAGWFANLEHWSEAEQSIEESLRRDAKNARVLMHAVHVYWLKGARDLAYRWLREALRLGHGSTAYERSPELREMVREQAFRDLVSEFPAAAGRPTPGPNGREESRS